MPVPALCALGKPPLTSQVWTGAFLSQCPLLSERLVFTEGQGEESQTLAVAAALAAPTFQTRMFVCSHRVCASSHERAKGENLKIGVTSAEQEEERDRSSSSLFILIKQDSADTQEVCSPRRGMVMTSPALQCKDEGWRRRVCAPCRSLLSHLHWRQHDTLPAHVQTRSSPLALCVLGTCSSLLLK